LPCCYLIKKKIAGSRHAPAAILWDCTTPNG
jgi:hypothetical protein